MIKLTDVGKAYGRQQVLEHIDLTLEDHKIYGLLGRNGVGKSTLLHLIAAQFLPTQGQISLDGTLIYETSKMEEVGLVKENGFGVDLKVKEYFRTASMLYPKWNEALKNELCTKFSVPQNKLYSKLSRGNQTLVSLITGLCSGCRFTFFDEPSLGLDAANRYHFYQVMLEEYGNHPRTFVISTHIIDEIASLFEEVIILKDQRVLIKENVATLTRQAYALQGDKHTLAEYASGKQVLAREAFGNSEILNLFGARSDQDERFIAEHNLQIEPISLQKLFVHLTEGAVHV